MPAQQDHGAILGRAYGCAVRETTVRIVEGLFSPHLSNLQRALAKATERQALLTNNLANINTPGFKRKDVDFSIALEEATGLARTGMDEAGRRIALSQGASHGEETSVRMDGSNVDLEFEVSSLAETELRYKALTEMTGRYFQGLKNAIREGR